MRKRAVRQIAVFAVVQLLICLVCRLTTSGTYTLVIPLNERARQSIEQHSFEVEMETPGILSPGEPVYRDGALRVPLRASAQGDTFFTVRSGGEVVSVNHLQTDAFHTVYDMNTGGFSGDLVVLCTTAVFWLAVSAIMIWNYTQSRGPSFYAYTTVYFAGFSLFALVSGLTIAAVAAAHLRDPVHYSMMSAYSTINGASAHYMRITTPLMLAFAIAMGVSNLALLRHERPRVQNALGLLISLLLMLGLALGWHLTMRDFSGSELESRIHSTFENVYATVFVYFECMLAGSMICGFRAARHVPEKDKDYIIILGCWFRKDGSLPPLLRGRVDRALSFWREQKAATGREALFIPSGGQGPDESMPEAEAMRRYLVAQGVPEELIRVENQSANTYQNMANSRALIETINPAGKAAFATTNYHVFRSGVWAAQAGLSAEGMGSRTKWWYWPNAFMREVVGLLQKRWKQELLLLALLTAYFALLSMVLG